tara:strand:- start:71256 stop:72008 length:753 start_codon:yes stop_codon:yes gene_type:complete
MKFSKKKFEEEYIPEEEQVEELFSPDGEFGGDTPHKPHSEIKTDTQKSFDDTSDFEPGVPQTGDDFASKTKNRSNWYGMTNMGQPYGSGVNHAVYTENMIKKALKKGIKKFDDAYDKGKEEFDRDEQAWSDMKHKKKDKSKVTWDNAKFKESSIKERATKLVRELMQNRTDASDFVKNKNYSDVNRNSIPDIDELNNSVVISKTKGFVNSVNSNGLSGEDIGVVLDFILTNINLEEVPDDFKKMIQSKFK